MSQLKLDHHGISRSTERPFRPVVGLLGGANQRLQYPQNPCDINQHMLTSDRLQEGFFQQQQKKTFCIFFPNQLDDLDFADDLALLSHTHEQMQIKTVNVAAVCASVGLNIHKGKTKVLKFKMENSSPITLDGKTLEDVESFTYLGSIIGELGGSDANVEARIGKAWTEFLQLNHTWN
ncbi:unnamed protein product [Schistosoma margrebowiei]|uniref:Uncharacterized protein n=1 Tax=Schistosoma margrebowiei TaxID=48269 RepID=A0A183M138_9TREM|nr:unnamed protein product [Schistosoma margrebowiei]